MLADTTETGGAPWDCCLRGFARRGLAALETEFGLTFRGAFEHEFHLDAVEERPNSAYALDALRRQGDFAGVFLRALRQAGLTPESIMPEYGPCQYEVTVAPAAGLRVADEAVMLREVARAVATRLDARASFTPMLRPDAVGNGVHVHFSLADGNGAPVNHDPEAAAGIAAPAGGFLAGVLAKLPALTALTAASTISYLRLTPNRWSAWATNLGQQDREAALRICPVFAAREAAPGAQFHFEYRAADAAASPYLVLGAIVWAGLSGLREGLPAPPATAENIAGMSDAAPRGSGDRAAAVVARRRAGPARGGRRSQGRDGSGAARRLSPPQAFRGGPDGGLRRRRPVCALPPRLLTFLFRRAALRYHSRTNRGGSHGRDLRKSLAAQDRAGAGT